MVLVVLKGVIGHVYCTIVYASAPFLLASIMQSAVQFRTGLSLLERGQRV